MKILLCLSLRGAMLFKHADHVWQYQRGGYGGGGRGGVIAVWIRGRKKRSPEWDVFNAQPFRALWIQHCLLFVRGSRWYPPVHLNKCAFVTSMFVSFVPSVIYRKELHFGGHAFWQFLRSWTFSPLVPGHRFAAGIKILYVFCCFHWKMLVK